MERVVEVPVTHYQMVPYEVEIVTKEKMGHSPPTYPLSSATDAEETAQRCFSEGMLASNADDHVAAVAAFTEGLRTSKSADLQSALYVSRCGALQSMGRWEDAFFDAMECQKLRPSWSRSFECRAACLDGMGRRKEANASRNHAKALAALKKDPKNEVDFALLPS